MNVTREITNPGSALGEAIGSIMEKAIANLVSESVKNYSCHYLTSGVNKTKSGTVSKKLLMYDNYGNDYNIDGVITNEHMQPLILFESKYIRYKKHNRDKGSWICQAHSSVRKRYHSIRSSIAVLAGSWSATSMAMIKSYDINIFLIPFNEIVTILSQYDIEFDWGEKEIGKAHIAWQKFSALTDDEKNQIGFKLIENISVNLTNLVDKILDDSLPRLIDRITIEFTSNLGEVKVYEFQSLDEALEFLNNKDLDSIFLTSDSLSLFDKPIVVDE